MGKSSFPQIPNPKKRAFLTAYAHCGQLTHAAKLAQCDISSHYDWKKADPAYVEAFALAREMAADLHEDEASRRALGWDEERLTEDGTPYTIRKYSDTLLIVRLKALKPDQYRESAKREDRSDVSELLKAVLLELVDRRDGRNVTPEAEWAPLPPATREAPRTRTALPAPPEVDDD